MRYNAADGTFRKAAERALMMDDSFTGENSGADIQITPDGHFLYGSNRGHNSLICYKADTETGLLCYVGMTDCHGGVPRNLPLIPQADMSSSPIRTPTIWWCFLSVSMVY